MSIRLRTDTPLRKELAKRIRRGIKLLDTVTPGWFKPINPETLQVSHRSACVFAQANHSFKEGIVQVANRAVEMGVDVKLLRGGELRKITGYEDDYQRFEKLAKSLSGIVIDVFHYGFDVDAELRKFVADDWDKRYHDGLGGRSHVWKELDAMWKSVVIQKKKAEAEGVRTRRSRRAA